MDSISRVKVLVAKMVAALRADEARPAMTKDERIRYTLKLQQMVAKLAQLEGSGQTASSVQRHGKKRPARASRARVIQVAMTNSYGRRQTGVKATCLAGNGISFAWGVHSRQPRTRRQTDSSVRLWFQRRPHNVIHLAAAPDIWLLLRANREDLLEKVAKATLTDRQRDRRRRTLTRADTPISHRKGGPLDRQVPLPPETQCDS